MRDKLQTQSNFNLDRSSKKNDQSGEKFFRRSTYHIAIAYNIYLNNIKTSGKDLQSPMMLDPTQPAKRLRG